MSQEIEVKKNMQSVLEHFKDDLKNIRTSRANSSMLDSVKVDVYGSHMRIKELANITVQDSRQIIVTPFDRNNVNAVSKGIEAANLNLQPIVDGHIVRINIPPMDEQIRKEMVKKCKEKAEAAKVRIREIRRKFNEILKKQKQSGDIAEDIFKKEEKLIQDLTDKFCKDIDLATSQKEREVLEV